MTSETRQKLEEVRVIGLVSIGHFFSHFYILTVPSVLPLIRDDLGASNLSLALILAAMAGFSFAGQYLMGVFCDRYGPRYFMIGGLAIMSSAIFLMGFAPVVPLMVLLAAVAGAADSVFHPADYVVLSARIRKDWHGKSFALHTFAGFLGFAAAPTIMIPLLSQFDWRTSISIVGFAGFAFAILLLVQKKYLSGDEKYPPTKAIGAKPAAPKIGVVQLIRNPVTLLLFLFYVATAFAGNGIQTFSNSALIIIYDIGIGFANFNMAGYLWGIAIGVLAGGLVADRFHRFDVISIIGYLVAASALVLIGMAVAPLKIIVVGMFVAGFMIGAVMPSRDIMVKSVTPPGATGKVFGFVSMGFGAGGFLGPLLFGTIMDLGQPAFLFITSAGLMMLTIAFAIAASRVPRNHILAPQPAE